MSTERKDRYTLAVDGVLVTADADQERRIRAMTPEQRANLARILGGGEPQTEVHPPAGPTTTERNDHGNEDRD